MSHQLAENNVLDYDIYTVILRASCRFGSHQFWAAVVRDDDQMNIHQMSGLNLDGDKFFYIKKISRDGWGIRWGAAFEKFEADVLDDYARVLARSAGTDDIPPEVGQVVTEGPMTCMEWVVFLIGHDMLSPEVLL